MSNTLAVRRGNRVLSYMSDSLGVGYVEGMSYDPTWGLGAVVRWADGSVGTWDVEHDVLTVIDGDTRLVDDFHNNVGRYCSVDDVHGRSWCVVAAVSGGRYLVAREHGSLPVDDAVRMVTHRQMSNLY